MERQGIYRRQGLGLNTPGDKKGWGWTVTLSEFLEDPQPGLMVKQYGDIRIQPLISFAQTFNLESGSGYGHIPSFINTRSIITLEKVKEGDYRFSSVTEDCGQTPDWYTSYELDIMKRLDQIYDKMQEQTKADESMTKALYFAAQLFATLYE